MSAHGTDATICRTSLTVEFPFAHVCMAVAAAIEHVFQPAWGPLVVDYNRLAAR